jgi:hypothetical protein
MLETSILPAETKESMSVDFPIVPAMMTGPADGDWSVDVWSFDTMVRLLPVTQPKSAERSWPALMTPGKSALLRNRYATDEPPASCKAPPVNDMMACWPIARTDETKQRTVRKMRTIVVTVTLAQPCWTKKKATNTYEKKKPSKRSRCT